MVVGGRGRGGGRLCSPKDLPGHGPSFQTTQSDSEHTPQYMVAVACYHQVQTSCTNPEVFYIRMKIKVSLGIAFLLIFLHGWIFWGSFLKTAYICTFQLCKSNKFCNVIFLCR